MLFKAMSHTDSSLLGSGTIRSWDSRCSSIVHVARKGSDGEEGLVTSHRLVDERLQ